MLRDGYSPMVAKLVLYRRALHETVLFQLGQVKLVELCIHLNAYKNPPINLVFATLVRNMPLLTQYLKNILNTY
jgi:hypothetical protein